eukprot:scaffold123325_cov51-Phaeocystis_antarctica.AAC.1
MGYGMLVRAGAAAWRRGLQAAWPRQGSGRCERTIMSCIFPGKMSVRTGGSAACLQGGAPL